MLKRIFLLVTFSLAAYFSANAQCTGFHKLRECTPPGINGFRPFGQSRSRMVEAKKTFKYKVVLYGGYDYKIGICTERGYYPIQFRIINGKDNSVFYDNADDDYIETVGFTVEETKNVIFEITILASKKEFTDATDARVCAGVAIYWRRVPKTGF
ncbi:MAG: hypothetical protein PWR03_2098 [Tenuifilum sp.]|jgi:hypothetical protein|uniref:hypothetical protein n=1 Tax=Tenuifilum sp. TaxID=2760880 RepID=UPI0024AB6CF0|nr:hypothetical protein [Tenuifilum sp.]MDI3527914.1 hypothetical protein [Tenuifilum sp.]